MTRKSCQHRLHSCGIITSLLWLFPTTATSSNNTKLMTPITNFNIKQAVDMWVSNPAEAVEEYGDITEWNTTSLSILQYVFVNTVDFNADLSAWDVSGVTSMFYLFFESQRFAANVSTWDTSRVRFMGHMFESTLDFQSDVSAWDTSQVSNMQGAFSKATQFGASIASWDLSALQDVKDMFHRATFAEPQTLCWSQSSMQLPSSDTIDLCTSQNVYLDCTCMEAYFEENEIACWRDHIIDTDGTCPFIATDPANNDDPITTDNDTDQNDQTSATTTIMTTTITNLFSCWTLMIFLIAMLP